MARLGARCWLIAGLLFWGRGAGAQIVNVQPLVMDPDQGGVSGSVNAALDLRTGNTRLLLLSAGVLIRYRSGRHLAFALGRQEYGVQGEGRFLSKDFEHLRYRFALLELMELEAFVQHDRDEFRRLALRVLGGAGPRFVLASTEVTRLAVGTAYMLELERLGVAPEVDSGEERVSHRLSTYFTLALRLDERLRLAQSAYAQPRLDRPGDVRILNETELLVSLGEAFLLKLTFSLGYDSLPPAGRRGLDTATKTGLELRF